MAYMQNLKNSCSVIYMNPGRFSFNHHGTDYGAMDGILIGFVAGGFVWAILFKIGLCSLALKGTEYEKSDLSWSWPILGGFVGFLIIIYSMLLLVLPLFLLSLGIERVFAVNPLEELVNSLNFFSALAIGPFIFSFVVPFLLEGHVRLLKDRSTQQDD